MKFSKLTKPELETIIENANFTEQEEEISSCPWTYFKRNSHETMRINKNSGKKNF